MIKNEFLRRIITGLLGGTLLLGAYYYSPHLFTFILSGIALYAIVYELPLLYSPYTKLYKFSLLLYVIFPTFVLIYITQKYYYLSHFIPLYPFVASWIFDTGSYLIGTLFGTHKIIPNITPKKSWEGLGGGLIFLLAFHYCVLSCSFIPLVTITLFIAACAFLGDLFESYLKRKAQVKDTGRVLPGHGGILDRFDSVFWVGIGYLFILLSGYINFLM